MEWKGKHRWLIKTRRLRAPFSMPDLPPLPSGTFPVYPMIWHPVRTRRTRDTDPEGRVIGCEYSYDYQPSEPEFQAELGPNDVVWIPLYEGTISHPATTEDKPRWEYERNLDAISQIAPKVRAITVGNANSEIHYEVEPEREYQLALDFIERHASLIRPYGRPAFGPIFEILLWDCYQGGGQMRDLLNSFDALVLSFAGCTWLFERKYPKIPEAAPFPTMSAYLRTLNAWSGVGLQRGLDAGSDRVLSEMGYSAGFMGSF